MITKRRRSRSSNREKVRNYSRERSRSRSRTEPLQSPRDSSLIVDDEKFYVPYRCLIPPDAAGSLIGRGAVQLRSLTSKTNVKCSVLRAEDNPPGLKDRILVLNGPQKEKDLGIKWVLDQMRGVGHGESYRSTFVFMLPVEAASPVIGTRGSVVYDISDRTGTEIDVMRERITGTNDRAVAVRGSAEGIVQAMSRIHSIVQGMHEQGKLSRKDFAYCEIFPLKNPKSISRNNSSSDPPVSVSFDVPEDRLSRTPFIIRITKEEGDWLVSAEILPRVREIEERSDCFITLEDIPGSVPEGLSVHGDLYGKKVLALEQVFNLLTSIRSKEQEPTEIYIANDGITLQVSAVLDTISGKSACGLALSEPSVVRIEGETKKQIIALKMLLARVELASQTDSGIKNSKSLKILVTKSQAKTIETISRTRFPDVKLSVSIDSGEVEVTGSSKSAVARTIYHILDVIGDSNCSSQRVYEEVDYDLI